MLEIVGTTVLCLGMVHVLRGGFMSDRGLTIVGVDIEGLSMGALALLLAAVYFGPLYGIAIMLSVMVHEFGHVAAFRIAGHSDARFRLIPLMGGVAISDREPETALHDFFITLMGPGICLVPMVLAYMLIEPAAEFSHLMADFLWVFAIVTGALNFFNLLPFWPLDGGRCLRILTATFAPGTTTPITLAMSAGFAAAAVATQSLMLLVFSLMGAQALFFDVDQPAPAGSLKPRQGLVALGAYIATASAHFVGGFVLLQWWL